MKTIRDFRKFFGRYDLKRKSRNIHRNSRIHNFNTARTAGIIFTCQHEEEFQTVRDFRHFLESNSIRTEVIGYVSNKQVPDYFLLRTGYNFFCQKDLTWYYRPDTPFTEGFMKKEFDLLFDLSLRNMFPVNYIVRISPAAYKIGRYCETGQHDLMIDIKENPSVGYLIEQIKHYLSMLHTRNGVVHGS